MTIVVDASVAVRWLLKVRDNKSYDLNRNAYDLIRTEDRIIAPDLVLVEIANAAWNAAAFEGVPIGVVNEAVGKAERGFHELISSIVLKDRALAIALELRHPVYDCFYLALAEQRECRLITADDRLLRRCAGTPFAARVAAL